MSQVTEQMKKWIGDFGDQYTQRNALSIQGLDDYYTAEYGEGITASGLSKEFLGGLNRDIKILEVGCNIGNQLAILQRLGFQNLYGIEINKSAIEIGKKNTKDISVIFGSAFDIPFKDNYFDLVFTAGVLIHINPKDVKKVLKEIHRCADQYIWGYEYYAERYTQVIYRGNKQLEWKANFPKIYTDTFKDLKLIKTRFLKYVKNDNVDVMFLLKK